MAWTAATVSCMVLLMDWCNGFKRSRTPPHVWSLALDGATTLLPVLWQLHLLPVRQRVQFKLAVLVFKALHGQSLRCLTDDCQLAVGRRQLRSCDAVTCATDPHMPRRSCAFGVGQMPDHVCGTFCRSASVSLTSALDSSDGR